MTISSRHAAEVVAGTIFAQGPVLNGGKPDMHGLVSVDTGGKVASGRRVESLRQ